MFYAIEYEMTTIIEKRITGKLYNQHILGWITLLTLNHENINLIGFIG